MTKPKRSLEDAGKQERIEIAKAYNDREINIAKALMNTPTIPNLVKAAYHYYNGTPGLGGQNEDGNIYITGEAPVVGGANKARNALEALQMIKAMKAAKAAKAAKTAKAAKVTRVMSDEHKAKLSAAGVAAAKAKRASMTTEELAKQNSDRVAKIKSTWEAKHSNNWQHTDNSGAFTSQELIETGLGKEDLSRHIITKRGGNRWVPDMKNGGSIYIAPSKRGTFTAAATKHGMGIQEFASRVLRNKDSYSPAMVKKANFARNASKWN